MRYVVRCKVVAESGVPQRFSGAQLGNPQWPLAKADRPHMQTASEKMQVAFLNQCGIVAEDAFPTTTNVTISPILLFLAT